MTDEKTAAKPGWYPDAKNPGQLRQWTGSEWTEKRKPAKVRRSFDGGDYMMVAFGVMVLGALVTAFAYNADKNAGIVVLSVVSLIASAFFGIAVVAIGVKTGIRAAERD